jgi:uncharacterized protein (UPF0335 family)
MERLDTEFISQELRDAWKKIEHLEEENKKLREDKKRMIKYVKELEEDLGFHRPSTGYFPQ